MLRGVPDGKVASSSTDSVTGSNGPQAGSFHLTMDDEVSGGAFSQNEAELRLDLAGETQVKLSFQWKEFGDETHSQDGIYFSDDDGASYVKVLNLNGGSTSNNSWQLVSLDVDELAASAGLSLSSTFVVKFQQYDNYPISSDGFCFDEIDVVVDDGGGGNPNRAQIGYKTGFETGSLDSFWSTASTPEGRILITTANGPSVGSWHMTMDDSVNGSAYARNEAWLLCDFSTTSQVTLSFRWKDFSDETHSQDGIYISDDNGASFVKIYNLNGGSISNNTWQSVALDIDAAAAASGLALNGAFVIKFQQYDNYSAQTDGMAFDNIRVTVAAPDTTPPTVTDRVPAPDSTITTADVDIDLTFSEAVQGVDSTDFVLTGTAAGSASVGTPANQGANTWRFPVTAGPSCPTRTSMTSSSTGWTVWPTSARMEPRESAP